ncbi:MAG: glycogen debranching protein, partial [Actinoallomurus sp.]
VYNHAGEGNEHGPTLCFRGIDNLSYYRLGADRRFCADVTGCGNSLNVRHPHSLQLIMDSLRYWVTEMHVDGFRFDLASALAREFHDVDRLAVFFDLVQQDPVVSQVKLIAEPWDVGEGGYQVGNFPPLWTEWNGKYRDATRDFWRGHEGMLPELARRFAGSSDLYAGDGRRPLASVNFVTCHDGFTLHDLVSYDHKHNEANGEEGRDGNDDNRSWNHGAEGETGDADILAVRERQKRNLLTTLLLSQGVPMISHGDEMGRTQHGNNNAYCQDNELSWVDWTDTAESGALREFVRRLTTLRRDHPVFRRRRFPSGDNVQWYAVDGRPMSDADWATSYAKAVTIFMNGDAITEPDRRGEPVRDDSFLLLINGSGEDLTFTLPSAHQGMWTCVIDTTTSYALEGEETAEMAEEKPLVEARSIQVLRRV